MNAMINRQLKAIIQGNHDWISNFANAAALLMQALKNVSWAGFYRYRIRFNDLILGPYQGKLACNVIKIGSGVCGTAAKTRQIQLVPDVNKFKGHIACDKDSRSEIVVPILKHGQLQGVLDLDSNQLNRFTSNDRSILETFVQILVNND